MLHDSHVLHAVNYIYDLLQSRKPIKLVDDILNNDFEDKKLEYNQEEQKMNITLDEFVEALALGNIQTCYDVIDWILENCEETNDVSDARVLLESYGYQLEDEHHAAQKKLENSEKVVDKHDNNEYNTLQQETKNQNRESKMNTETFELPRIVLTKKDGTYYASKTGAANALKAFKTLNSDVLSAQAWSHFYKKECGKYIVIMDAETDEMFPSIVEGKSRVIYRTKADKKKDNPMFDERPTPKTEREIELENELQELKQEPKPVNDNTQELLEIERLKNELEQMKEKNEQLTAAVEQAKVEAREEVISTVVEWVDNNTKDSRYFEAEDVKSVINQMKDTSDDDVYWLVDARLRQWEYNLSEEDLQNITFPKLLVLMEKNNKPMTEEERAELDAAYCDESPEEWTTEGALKANQELATQNGVTQADYDEVSALFGITGDRVLTIDDVCGQ